MVCDSVLLTYVEEFFLCLPFGLESVVGVCPLAQE